MKRGIKIIVLCVLLCIGWIIGYLTQYQRPARVEFIDVVQLEKVYVIDTISVDKIVEEKIYVPKYITKIKRDTVKVEVPIEVIVEKRIPITKKVYVEKIVDNTTEVPVTIPKNFLGFGYQYDFNNYFSGANIKFVHKTAKDKMFSLDIGVRNDLLDTETNVGKLRPYVGGSIYFRIDN